VRSGLVSLVGAGPGDPELLTIRALRRLREADVVLYDALVPLDVLELAAHAQRVSVGKRAGRPSVRQDTIHSLMRRMAQRGRRVVRLKCGDPFVLGRGGEEALALAAAGVPVEIVPGVSTAIAAPALAGIPVTHRGVASAFVVCSGHDVRAFGKLLASLAPESVTLVVLMGLAMRAALAQQLVERGWSPGTPAAVLLAASTARSLTWTGTLADLSRAPAEQARGAPGTIVVGEVVNIRAAVRWSLHEASDRDAPADDGRGHVRAPGRRSAVR